MLLETRDLTIRFGGHVAVNAVTCAFRPGELTAIVGPNGAGKTTYFNLISGQLRASAGQRAARRRATSRGCRRPLRTRAGLGRAFQLTNLFPEPQRSRRTCASRCSRAARRALRHAARLDARTPS